MSKIKEEAYEFVNKFRICKHDRRLVSFRIAQQCALLSIAEILYILGGEGVFGYADPKVETHYQELKEEIEKL